MKLIAILLAASSLPLVGQWLNYPDARTPRSKDGKPNLTAPAPRMNGKPDLSGVWQAERIPEREFTRVLGDNITKLQVDLADVAKLGSNVFWGLKPEEQPLRPERRRSLNSAPTLHLPTVTVSRLAYPPAYSFTPSR
jgi:hypothetical protein